MEIIGFLWNEVIIRPMINGLVFLYSILFSNMGLSIIFFTLIVRCIMLPLTLKQIRSMRRMSTIQPKLTALREKYKNDPKKLSQETLGIYKQAGVNPLGCLGPMVIQFPIWIGLYQALIRTLPTNPDSLVGLSEKLYSWLPFVHTAVPLSSQFLWMDLVEPDPSVIIMPVLVGATTWAQQKMSTMPSADPRQQSTNSMMLWMFPLMLGVLSLTFPSGLSLYWIVSNSVGIGVQYFITGWGPLFAKAPAPVSAPAVVEAQPEGEKSEDGKPADSGSVGQERRGSHRGRNARSRRRSRRGRS